MKPFCLGVVALLSTVFVVSYANAQDSRDFSKTVPLKANGEVIIDTYKGSIKVSTWDKPQVEILATIEADDAFDSDDAEEKVRDTEVRVDATESRVRIKTDYDNIHERRHSFWSWFDDDRGSLPLVHYTIHMPATASLNIKDYKSRSSVQDLRSDLVFNSYKGEVEITNLVGSLKLETYKGEAKVEFNMMKERCNCETYKGSITLALPKSAGFNLDADLGYRTHFSTDFEVELETHGRHHSNSEYHGPVNGGGSSLVLRSTKGNIRLRQR